MTDTPETQPVEGAEILRLLRSIDAQTRANGKHLSRMALTLESIHSRLRGGPVDEPQDVLRDILTTVQGMRDVVDQAAPLLQSRAVRAMRTGGSVLDHLRGGRSGA